MLVHTRTRTAVTVAWHYTGLDSTVYTFVLLTLL